MVQRASHARVALAATLLARLWLGGLRVPSARAQAFDCEDVDHDCDPADKTVARGIKRTGADLVDCVRHAVNPCDLTSALARVNDPQCAAAIECEVRGLFAEVGDGSTSCVLTLSDDQRWDTVDATHQSPERPGYVMPNVKKELTDSGVTFTEGHVTTSLCCPSRTSILTGEYAHRTGIHDNSPPDGGAEVFDDHCTLARWLKAQNYQTGFVGKYLNGYASLSPCIPPGYDDWHVQVQVKYYEYDLNDNGKLAHYDSADADYSGDVMTRKAVDFIHGAGREGRRFFLHLSQKAPHAPATPARRHIGLFNGIAPFRPPNWGEPDVSDKPAWVQSLTWDARGCNTCPAHHKCDACETDKFRQLELESLQAVDEGVASIMKALRDIGQSDNTLVIFTSDNGYSWGSHRWKPKQCPYEECIRVPMIMRYPDL